MQDSPYGCEHIDRVVSPFPPSALNVIPRTTQQMLAEPFSDLLLSLFRLQSAFSLFFDATTLKSEKEKNENASNFKLFESAILRRP